MVGFVVLGNDDGNVMAFPPIGDCPINPNPVVVVVVAVVVVLWLLLLILLLLLLLYIPAKGSIELVVVTGVVVAAFVASL